MAWKKQSRHKFGAVRVERDGHKFPSKKEGNRYDELKMLQEAGEVIWLMLQPPFYFPASKYVADFMIFWADGTCTVEDVKGFKTPKYKADLKRMAIHYPSVTIQEI